MNRHDQWFDGIARNLIQHAARKAPRTLSDRLGEEWLADLTGRSGALAQLRFALGCCWATTVIAHEFGAPARAAAPASGGKTTVVDLPGSARLFSRRTTVILLIVGFHVLVVCVLATTIVTPRGPKPEPLPRIDASFLPRPEPPLPPTSVDPALSPVSVDLPTPEGPQAPAEQAVTTPDPVTDARPARTADPPLLRPVNRVLGGPGAGFPNTDDFYPPESIRLHEMGIATVAVCVDGAGRLMRKPTIDQSSGRTRLDEAAVKLAQAGSGHYRATTEDGRPVSACYPFRVRFQFRDRD